MKQKKEYEFSLPDKALLKRADAPVTNLNDLHQLLNLFVTSINHKIEDVKEIQQIGNYQAILAGIILATLASLNIFSLLSLILQQKIWLISCIIIGLCILLLIFFYICLLKTETLLEQHFDIVILKIYINKINSPVDFNASEIIKARKLIEIYKNKLKNKNNAVNYCKSNSVAITALFSIGLLVFFLSITAIFNFIPNINNIYHFENKIKKEETCTIIGKAQLSNISICIRTDENHSNPL